MAPMVDACTLEATAAAHLLGILGGHLFDLLGLQTHDLAHRARRQPALPAVRQEEEFSVILNQLRV